jgi:hypothetical protein
MRAFYLTVPVLVIFILGAGTADAEILFESDWSTCTSPPCYDDESLRDINKTVPWDAVISAGKLSIVDADSVGLVNWPSTNAMKVYMAGSGRAWVRLLDTGNHVPMPPVGGSTYYRWYFQHTVPDGPEYADRQHVVEQNYGGWGTGDGGWVFRTDVSDNVDGKWELDYHVYLPSSARVKAPGYLDKDATYRIEIRQKRTGDLTFDLHFRVYTGAGLLVYNETDFGTLSGAWEATTDIAELQMGINGYSVPSWPGDFNYCYYGAVCIRNDTWCGAYEPPEICEVDRGAGHECYYVSPDGDDLNSGTSYDEPFKTFLPAVSSAGPGDIIYALGGTYDGDNRMAYSTNFYNENMGPDSCDPGDLYVSNRCHREVYTMVGVYDWDGWASDLPGYSVSGGTAENPITLRNYPGEHPVFTGYGIKVQESYWIIEGIEVTKSNIMVYGKTGECCHDIYIRNNIVHDYQAYWSYNSGLIKVARNGGPYNVYIHNNVLYDGRICSDAACTIVAEWDEPAGYLLGGVASLSSEAYNSRQRNV